MENAKNKANNKDPKAPISLQCTKEATNGVSLIVSPLLNFGGILAFFVIGNTVVAESVCTSKKKGKLVLINI